MGHLLENLNSLDYVLMGLIAFSIVISFFRGFLKEAISLLTWFLAFVLALKFAPDVGPLLHPFISHDKTRYIVAAIILFIVVMIAGMIVNKLVHMLVTTSGLGLLDKILGIVFGAARGILLVVILLLVINASPYDDAKWLQSSQLAPCFQGIVKRFDKMVPKEIHHVFRWISNYSSLPAKKYNSHPITQTH